MDPMNSLQQNLNNLRIEPVQLQANEENNPPPALPQDTTGILSLPNEIFLRILDYVPQRDWKNVFTVCKKWLPLRAPLFFNVPSIFWRIYKDRQGYFKDSPSVVLQLSQNERAFFAQIKRLTHEKKDLSTPLSAAPTVLQTERDLLAEIKRLVNEKHNSFNLSYSDFTDEELATFATSSFHTKALNLSGCKNITEEGLKHLGKLTRLEWLSLSSNTLTGVLLSYLQPLSQLRSLILSQCTIDMIGMQQFYLPRLQVLDLSYSTIHSMNTEEIGVLSGFSTLESLNLSHTDITDEELAAFINSSPHLKALNLSGCKNITEEGLKHLGKLTRLEWLSLSSNTLTGALFSHLQSLSQLRSLILSQCTIDMTDTQPFRLPYLQSLDLSYSTIITRENEETEVLSGLSRLESLDLSRSTITSKQLCGIRNLTTLQSLNLSGCKALTDTSLQWLADLKQLKTLSLRNCLLSDRGLNYLRVLTSLEFLDLSGCSDITGSPGLSEEDEHLFYIHLSQLQSLNLSRCTRLSNKALASLVKLPMLRTLDLSESGISDLGVEHLQNMPFLQSLNLASCKDMSDPALPKEISDAALTSISSLQELTFLNLSGCTQVTDAGVKLLTQCTQLETINLEFCKIKQLDYFSQFSHLRSLNLAHCPLTNEQLAFIKDLIHLESLNLSYCNKIDDEGLKHLQKLTNLKELDVSTTTLSDAGLESLKNCTQLERLSVGGTAITGTGFAKVAHLSNLKSLNLGGCYRLEVFKFLQPFRNLTSLNLNSCSISLFLQQLPNWFPSLESVNLNSCNLEWEIALPSLKKIIGLKSLFLAHCNSSNPTRRIGDAELQTLATFKNLESLHLNNCPRVTAAGVRHLQQLKNLKLLNLYLTSPEGIEELKTLEAQSKQLHVITDLQSWQKFLES